MIQRCRKTLHSRTKENRLVIQIQKALWRKLEPLFSRNKKALRFKRGQRKCACIRGQILPTRNNNHSKSICVSWPLSVKHAAKITFAQWKCRTFQSIIYPAEKKNFIGISNILAWGKSRVGLPPPFIASNDARTLSKPTKSSPLLANNPHILMLSVKWWRSISHSKDERVKIALSSSVSAAIFLFCKSRKECWDLVKPIDRDDMKSITSRTKMRKKFYIS